jgi:hypothetical protein
MSLRLLLLERHVPAAFRRLMLRRLVQVTADAFGTRPPRIPGDASFVQAYAEFTRSESERIAEGDAAGAEVRGRLYAGAEEMGRSIRMWAGVRTPDEAVRALRLVYRAIGIDLHVDLPGGAVAVRRCAFSDIYTPPVCHFVSALDAGLFHGISGRWSVAFDDRITNGAPACRGRLTEAFIP